MITWKTSGHSSTLAMLVLMLSGVHSVWGYQESAIPIAAVQRDKPVDFTSDVLLRFVIDIVKRFLNKAFLFLLEKVFFHYR